ncbi:MAG TPA: glycerophosphodiester phosphodiesterase family protein, partial [Solimonas sp.]
MIRHGVAAKRLAALAMAGTLGACGVSSEPVGTAASCPVPGTPLISAHRGGAAYAPENTMTAFANAARLGVDELEMDTQLTADGELVVIHDDTLDRTTNCSGSVGAMTLADIEACDAAYWFAPGQDVTVPADDRDHPLRGHGIHVPTLRDVLDWHAALPCQPRLSIEIKNIPGEANFDPLGGKIATVLVPMLQSYGLADSAVVQ